MLMSFIPVQPPEKTRRKIATVKMSGLCSNSGILFAPFQRESTIYPLSPFIVKKYHRGKEK
jgi:hypothetical protein